MATRLVIHIGMHKTGTSSVQRFLSRNRLALRACGVAYPPSFGADGRRQPKHNAIFTAISHEADFGAPHSRLGPSAALVDAMAARIERSRARVAILSAEGFSGERPVFAAALAPLAQRFETRIVVFIRRPDHWVESFYKQMVFSPDVAEARPFPAFLAGADTEAHLDFAGILRWWAAAFGAPSLRIAGFAPPYPGRALTRLFLRAADLPQPLALLPFAAAHENPGPSAAETEMRRRENMRLARVAQGGDPGDALENFCPETQGGPPQLAKTARLAQRAERESEAPAPSLFTDDGRRAFLHAHADGLREISERYPLVPEFPPFM